jgi:plasmid maintenance system killer protein
MELVFNEKAYDRLEVDASYTHGFSQIVVGLYRSRLQLLRAAQDEQDLKALKSLSFLPLPQRSPPQHAIRLDDVHTLVVELQQLPSRVALNIVEVRANKA